MRGKLAKQLRRLAQQAMPGSAIRHDAHITRHVPANIHSSNRSTSVIVRCDPQSARTFYQKSKQVIKDHALATAAGLKGLAMHRELARTYNEEVAGDLEEGAKIDASIQQSLQDRYPGMDNTSETTEVSPAETTLTDADVDALFGQKPLRGDSLSYTAIDDAPSGGSERGDTPGMAHVYESPFIEVNKEDRDTSDSL